MIKVMSGHVVLVYEILYDEDGYPKDALIREATGSPETSTSKIKFNYASLLNENNNIYEGVFQERYLANTYKAPTYNQSSRNSVLANIRANSVSKFAIIRPLAVGNVTPTASTNQRITYSKIDIEKTVDVFNNSVVCLGDELKYTIEIKNNSNVDYSDIEVIENISDLVEVKENSFENGILDGNTLKWSNIEIPKNETVVLEYVVKVKPETENISKAIISTGSVAGIDSGAVTNLISGNFDNQQKKSIKSEFLKAVNEKKTGENFVIDVYKNALNVDLNNPNSYNIANLDFSKLIKNKTTEIGDETYTDIYLEDNNELSEIVLNNYYGQLTEKNGKMTPRKWILADGRSTRADNIYEGNFQTGDILIYQNSQTNTDTNQYSYKNEDGIYYLIYLSKEDKITINSKPYYGFIGFYLDENNYYRIKHIYGDESSEPTPDDLRTLLAKDYYVILRPALSPDIIPLELTVNYSTQDKTNTSVDVTITANKRILPAKTSGWTLSEDGRSLSKTYTSNVKGSLKVRDIVGNSSNVSIQISNIVKATSSVYNINQDTRIIDSITPNTSVKAFMENISHTNVDSCYVATSNGTPLNDSDIIATGYKLILDEISYSLAVSGDVNGNGEADFFDIIEINKHRLDLEKLNNLQITAGDIDKNGKADFFDMLAINNYRLGLSDI